MTSDKRMSDKRLGQLRDDHDYRDSLDHDEVNELFAEIDALRAEAKYTDDAVTAARKMLEDAHAESIGKMANELQKLRTELTAARTVGLENYNRACRERDEARAALAQAREAAPKNAETRK